MYKLSRRRPDDGQPSAMELIEATKHLYVKTEALKDKKIDVNGPRLFKKTDSEEELALLYHNCFYDNRNRTNHSNLAGSSANMSKSVVRMVLILFCKIKNFPVSNNPTHSYLA
ncbi:hypothetical protein Ddc_11134 [Ditylenchus destructor]|nr:hypothetical protein Ddc_11134 [Ditylenchus destructor]